MARRYLYLELGYPGSNAKKGLQHATLSLLKTVLFYECLIASV